jgi:chorismate mutase
MSEPAGVAAQDHVLAQLREQIADTDRAIVDAINRRLKLVTQIRRYKESRGLPFLDPSREEWMLRYLTRANRGPLSEEGLREVYTELLDLTKREVTRGDAQ